MVVSTDGLHNPSCGENVPQQTPNVTGELADCDLRESEWHPHKAVSTNPNDDSHGYPKELS
jgi:hypothetical protein